MPEDQRKNRTHQPPVVMAVELLQPKGFGRIRLRRTDNDSASLLLAEVGRALRAEATNG